MPDSIPANEAIMVGERVRDTKSNEMVTVLRLLTAGVNDFPVAAAVRREKGTTEYRALYELRREG